MSGVQESGNVSPELALRVVRLIVDQARLLDTHRTPKRSAQYIKFGRAVRQILEDHGLVEPPSAAPDA